MLKRKEFLLIFLVVFIAACGSAPDPAEEKPEEEIAEEHTPTLQQPDKRIGPWLEYYGLSAEDFSHAETFESGQTFSMEYQPESPDPYQDLYIYSRDSSKFIDMDSYSMLLEKEPGGEIVFRGWNVDKEVALIDLDAKQRKRIFFCGTPCIYEEASFWGEKVVVAGFVDDNNGYQPAIWMREPGQTSLTIKMADLLFAPAEINYLQKIRVKNVVEIDSFASVY